MKVQMISAIMASAMVSCSDSMLFNLIWMSLFNKLDPNSLHVFNKQLVRRLLFSYYFESIVVANMPSWNALVVGKGSILKFIREYKTVLIPVQHLFISLRALRNFFASLASIITENNLAEVTAFTFGRISYSRYFSHFIIFIKLGHCSSPSIILRPPILLHCLRFLTRVSSMAVTSLNSSCVLLICVDSSCLKY